MAILESRTVPTTPELLLQVLESILKWNPNVVPLINASDDTLTLSQQSLVNLERQRQELKFQVIATELTTHLVAETGAEWRERPI